MNARTPGPWVADDGDGGDWGVFDAPTGGGIAYCFEPNGKPLENGEADATFIVLACNAHDELVAALERIAEYCGNRGAALPSVAHMARAALAKALLP